MEKSPLLQAALVLCAFVASTIIRSGCLASCFAEGKNWTTSSLHGSYPQLPNFLREGSGSFQATENGANDWTFQYATHTWNPDFGGSYYGLEATSDVYGFGLRFTQQSGSEIGIYSMVNGKVKSGILVGWHVLPALYQDSNTHFFTFWTNGQSQCYNTNCSAGFIRTSGSAIAPGDIIYPSSKMAGRVQYISLRVFKDPSSGNWQVHCGFNGPARSVGYFPKEVVPLLSASKEVNISVGGFTGYRNDDSNIPMGNGNVPPNKAASINHLQFIDAKGGNHAIDKDLPSISTNNCYRVSPIVGGQFSYGGPSNCA